MKKLLLLLALALLGSNGIAQEKTYLLFEFMRVDNAQEQNYWEVESFWEKIHEQRIKNGDIVGWDLWAIKPGGEDQGYQYMTVNVYNDPVKMFSGSGNFREAVDAAYPELSDEDWDKMMKKTVKSRDLAIRDYIEVIDATQGEFNMEVGTVAEIGFMKVLTNNGDYVKAEREVFKPFHQQVVDAGGKGNWQLLEVMLPKGSDRYVDYMAVNMYKDYEQYLGFDWSSVGELGGETLQKINEGLKTREMKNVILLELVKKVR
jgi:hypothetical protein